jgi:hypothetical protein
MTARTVAFIIASDLFLITVGVACLIWPKEIQSFVVSHESDLAFYHPLKFLKSGIRTRYYLWELRLIGSLSIVVSVLVAVTLIKSFLRR